MKASYCCWSLTCRNGRLIRTINNCTPSYQKGGLKVSNYISVRASTGICLLILVIICFCYSRPTHHPHKANMWVKWGKVVDGNWHPDIFQAFVVESSWQFLDRHCITFDLLMSGIVLTASSGFLHHNSLRFPGLETKLRVLSAATQTYSVTHTKTEKKATGCLCWPVGPTLRCP